MKPRKSILDKSFAYVPSHQTNVKETIERAKREQAQQRLSKIIRLKERK